MARDSDNLLYHLITVFTAFLMLLTIGVIGYSQLEGWAVFEALYMTFISFSTVGYQEVAPMSSAGRVFTMFVIFLGMIVISMLSASVTSWFVRNELLTKRKIYKMQQKITKLKKHIIICGGGDTGETIMNEFIRSKKPFVVIEHDPEVVEELREKFPGQFIIQGAATKDEMLEEANISTAAGLITAIPVDADNLFIVVSARALNPKMTIISRSVDPQTESKLYKAGANYVISPKMVEGMRMASFILRPAVVDFLDVMIDEDGLSLRMEEVTVPESSSLVNKSLLEAQIPQRTGLIVLAAKRAVNNEWNFNPASSMILDAGDRLIVLGGVEKISKLQSIIKA